MLYRLKKVKNMEVPEVVIAIFLIWILMSQCGCISNVVKGIVGRGCAKRRGRMGYRFMGGRRLGRSLSRGFNRGRSMSRSLSPRLRGIGRGLKKAGQRVTKLATAAITPVGPSKLALVDAQAKK